LSVEELEERFGGCQDATASRHFQVIWLLARGHPVSQVSATTAFGERWIEQLLARYNAEGPEALGDLRRRNGATATILKPELLARLRDADLNELLASAGGKFPTGAMASFRFDGAWKVLEPHGAVLASYTTPKAIAASSHDRREHVLLKCR
jgi:hypothetical protein